jgi:hypothetical protein
MRLLRCAAALGAFGLWISGSPDLAVAAPVSEGTNLQVFVNGVESGNYYSSALGCAAGSGDLFSCSGSGLTIGSLTLDSWTMTFDTDPSIAGVVAVTNNLNITQHFTLIFTLPVAAIPGSSLTRGSVGGSVTDSANSDTATVAAPAGSAIYTSMIDGVLQTQLYADPSSFLAPVDISGNVPATSFGSPVYLPGPAVATTIGIQLDFTLTAGDSASFTSNHIVLPVPEPAPATMMLLGLGALALRRRRSVR